MTSPKYTTLIEDKGIIHDIAIKAFGSVITLNDIFMSGSKCITIIEIKENIHGTWSHDSQY